MNNEQQLLEALLELESSVQSMATADPKPDLIGLFERIDQLTAALPKGTDPELLHFLHKKSYEKARLFLQGRCGEIKKGPCH